jgi:hypothetical protein
MYIYISCVYYIKHPLKMGLAATCGLSPLERIWMFPRRVRTARARRCPELEVDKAFSIPTGNIWKNPGFMPVKWDEHDETLWKTLVSWEKNMV